MTRFKTVKYYKKGFIFPFNIIRRTEFKKLKQILPHKNYNHSLEIGAGTGTYTKHIKNLSNKLTVIDQCEESLSNIDDNNITKEITVIENFKPNNNYDFIFSSGVVEFLNNEQRQKYYKLITENKVGSTIIYSFVPNTILGRLYVFVYNFYFKENITTGKLPYIKDEQTYYVHPFRSYIKAYSRQD